MQGVLSLNHGAPIEDVAFLPSGKRLLADRTRSSVADTTCATPALLGRHFAWRTCCCRRMFTYF